MIYSSTFDDPTETVTQLVTAAQENLQHLKIVKYEKKCSEENKMIRLRALQIPGSKLKTCEILQKKFGLDISVDKIYKILDALFEKNDLLQ